MNNHISKILIGSILVSGAPVAHSALEEIIVTATKRAATLQDVPVSVAAVSSDLMEKVGISDMEDLSVVVPNFEINSSAIIPNLYIRGLGGGLTHSIEQSVGRFVDDVYIGRSVINLHPFLDVGAVEVLRGPQGTLFGKNTAAGAMVVRTNNPTDEFEAGLNVSYGTYETTGGVAELSGFVSGPLSETVNGRLAVIYKDQQGYYENVSNGPDGADREDFGIRGKFSFDVSDTTTIGLKLEYMTYEEDGSNTGEVPYLGGKGLAAAQAVWENSGAPGYDSWTAGHDWKVGYNCGPAFAVEEKDSIPIGAFCPNRDQESTNITLDVEHELTGGTVKVIVAQQEYDYIHQFQGFDGGMGNHVRATRDEAYDNLSTEVRFTSEEDEAFDYIAGLYYEDSEVYRQQDTDFNVVGKKGPKFVRDHDPWTQGTETLAAFMQGRWHLNDKLTAIVGGRWSSETKDFEFEQWETAYGTNDGAREQVISVRNESRDETKFTPAATLQYDFSDNINLFATISQGHKTGGFSDRVESQTAKMQYDAEVIDAIELGMKGRFLDDSLTLNVTLFNMEIEGLQLATQIAGTVEFAVDNAADSTSQGVELETVWAANDNLTLGANYSYTDATYDEFIGSDNCDTQYKNADDACDMSGATLQYAPEHKGYVYADYFAESAVNGWGLGARVDVSYSDDHYTDISLQPFTLTEAHSTTGASVRLVSPDEKTTISLVGRNLGNEKINAWTSSSGPNSISAMAPPRMIMFKLAMKF